ncbi:MAG: 16S rRNA (adenine(1518)-N(6)/adenine(1519)-N(6))-dimethyltransferase RsmA [Ruminiclostridium sp.]|nr:16S rRNA (adenine(1518)-N(6)/adenine(1519)-N(6))-dimethyltransferase RsmA [Ruminiclostridium sp.]
MKLTDIGTIKNLFEKHGFSFTKSLGQNFLINPSVCPKIAEMGGAGKEVGAIEIGTGIGVLTRELAERCKKVVAVEIDTSLKPILEETLADYNNVEVVFADVLETDLNTLIKEKFGDMEVIVCANLPYYITSPVIMKLLEEKLPIKAITVMVQLEAADRICAKVGSRECGAITAAVNYYAKPEKLFRVNRGSFMPAPNVDSAVISIKLYDEPPYRVDNEKLFFDVIKQSFSQRRKQLINPVSSFFKISKQELSSVMEQSGLKPSARAEELSMNDFVTLYRIIEKLKG